MCMRKIKLSIEGINGGFFDKKSKLNDNEKFD